MDITQYTENPAPAATPLDLWPSATCCLKDIPGVKRALSDGLLFCHCYPEQLVHEPLDAQSPESMAAHWPVNGNAEARALLKQFIGPHLKDTIPHEWHDFLQPLTAKD